MYPPPAERVDANLDTPMTSERRCAALMMAGIGPILSLLYGWLLASSITVTIAAWGEGASEVRISGGDVRMLALMPIFVALSVWGTLAVFRNDGAVKPIGNGIAVTATIVVPVALGASWVFQVWVEQKLSAQGYVRCGVDRVGRVDRFPALTLCARKRR